MSNSYPGDELPDPSIWDSPCAPPAAERKGRKYIQSNRAPVAYLDMETTGLRRVSCDILEVAVDVVGGPGVDVLQFRPSERALEQAEKDRAQGGRNALDVVGFDERRDWFMSAQPIGERLGDLAKLVHGKALIGHNARNFDAPWLATELHMAGWRGWYPRVHVDTMIMCKAMLGPHGLERFSMDACRAFVGLPEEGVHTAEGGVTACRELVERLGDLVMRGLAAEAADGGVE